MMPATARPLPRSPRRSICGRLMIDSTSPTSAVTGKQHSTRARTRRRPCRYTAAARWAAACNTGSAAAGCTDSRAAARKPAAGAAYSAPAARGSPAHAAARAAGRIPAAGCKPARSPRSAGSTPRSPRKLSHTGCIVPWRRPPSNPQILFPVYVPESGLSREKGRGRLQSGPAG